jgi:hypothetical protein
MLNDLKSQLGQKVQAVRSLFDRPIKVQRGNVQLGVPQAQARAQERESRHTRVRTMQAELRQLLDQHPGTRKLMRHLALVEFTLRYKGLTAMQAMPTRVIARALAELERLVWDWSPVGLAELRSRLAVLVKNPPPGSSDAEVDAAEQAAGPVSQPHAHPHVLEAHAAAEITEIDHAAFEEMERSWARQMPPPAVRAPGAA